MGESREELRKPEFAEFVSVLAALQGGTFKFRLKNEDLQGEILSLALTQDSLQLKAARCLRGAEHDPILKHPCKDISIKLSTSAFFNVHYSKEGLQVAILTDEMEALVMRGPGSITDKPVQ